MFPEVCVSCFDVNFPANAVPALCPSLIPLLHGSCKRRALAFRHGLDGNQSAARHVGVQLTCAVVTGLIVTTVCESFEVSDKSTLPIAVSLLHPGTLARYERVSFLFHVSRQVWLLIVQKVMSRVRCGRDHSDTARLYPCLRSSLIHWQFTIALACHD